MSIPVRASATLPARNGGLRLHCGRFDLDLGQPLVMAIVNVTPDSFTGDGLARQPLERAVQRAEQAIAVGADILDIGGESSRPGAAAVSVQEELDRVIPLIEALAPLGVPLSVDTVKPEVMAASIAAGADLINDINALRAPGAIDAIRDSRAAVCLMHMQGEPRTMQQAPQYDDVVTEVADFLDERVLALQAAGVSPARIVLDPGFGFGKRFAHNQALFRALPAWCAGPWPWLVGVSRKTMLGDITGSPVNERLMASVTAAVLAADAGAAILRVHDVADTVDALKVWAALRAAE